MKIMRESSYFVQRNFVLFVTDSQSMFLMPTRFLKYSIDGVRLPQFQPYYIIDTTHPSYKYLLWLFHDVNYMWCGKQ